MKMFLAGSFIVIVLLDTYVLEFLEGTKDLEGLFWAGS